MECVFQLDRIVGEVQDLVDQAAKCTIFDAVCWANLAKKVAEDATKIPVQVGEAITTTLRLLGQLTKSALSCEHHTLQALTDEANSLLTNVTECIQNKINNGTKLDEDDYYGSSSQELY